jgi:hypothetical protein
MRPLSAVLAGSNSGELPVLPIRSLGEVFGFEPRLDVTFNEPPSNVRFHSDFVIVGHAKELRAVLSDAGGLTVATSVSKRQSATNE